MAAAHTADGINNFVKEKPPENPEVFHFVERILFQKQDMPIDYQKKMTSSNPRSSISCSRKTSAFNLA